MSRTSPPRGLIVDYGGVLTTSIDAMVRSWAGQDAIDLGRLGEVMGEWAGLAADASPVHDLEAGRLQARDFEALLAGRLRRHDGRTVRAEGLLGRMFGHLDPEPRMYGMVRGARDLGIATALLSNSWGNDYPRHLWDGAFDAVVISGEVGMRKPDPEIYLHTAARLGLAPAECVFVDDIAHNVHAAVALGMVGVHHRDVGTTAYELEAVFGRSLTGPGAT